MQITKKDLPKSQAELIVELSEQEMKPYLESAAEEISKSKNIAGFRPGKAPFNIVIKEVGEMTVYQTAASLVIEATVYKIIDEQKLEIVDQPKVDIQKLAPGNPFIYKATVNLTPSVELCDYDKINVKPAQEIKIEEKEIAQVVQNLRSMRAKETLEKRAAKTGDKVEIDFDVFVDNVPIDGGAAKKHLMVIGENRMIPGFEENLVGMSAGDAKEFELSFPKNYHEKNLQDKKALFKVKTNAVYKIELPELNDEFAKGFGLTTMENLNKNIESNIKHEKDLKETQRLELEIIEAMLDKCSFGELPDSLVDEEAHKMVHELEDNVERQGMKFDDYLSHLKKTEADLRLDFVADAIKRVKTGLLVRAVAQKENVQSSDKEIDEEIEKTLASYKLNPAYEHQLHELEKNLRSENARRYFGNVIKNRKTLELLKEKILKK